MGGLSRRLVQEGIVLQSQLLTVVFQVLFTLLDIVYLGKLLGMENVKLITHLLPKVVPQDIIGMEIVVFNRKIVNRVTIKIIRANVDR